MELNQLYVGDCVELLGKVDDGVVQLTVTSPPYDNLRKYKGFSLNVEGLVEQLFRVTRDGGIVVWVTCDATINGSETGTSFRQALTFMSAGFRLHDTMIFRKKNPIPQIYRKRYNNEFEYMFVFSKGPVATHNPIMVDCLHAGLKLKGTTYKNFSTGDQKRGKLAKPVKDKKIAGNIWEYVVGKRSEDQTAKFHSAPFPCKLVADHINSWSNPGDLVLDPLCGSGTTPLVAKHLGRNYLGMDMGEEYVEQASIRIEANWQNLNLDD